LSLVSFCTSCSWDILRGRSIATMDTVVPINIEVPTKYPLSQDRIVVFEIRLHNKSPMLYRPALNGNWKALSLARRAFKDKFPTPTVPLTAVLQNLQVFLPAILWPSTIGSYFHSTSQKTLYRQCVDIDPDITIYCLEPFTFLTCLSDSMNQSVKWLATSQTMEVWLPTCPTSVASSSHQN
jgi:hypothetical protein